jgi:RNA polymerase sigma-70 factor (ECF subfamily)
MLLLLLLLFSSSVLATLFSRKVQAGEFESVAMPHMGDIYRTAARVIGDSTSAEDVLQDVYLQAWKSFHQFQPGTNCKAWLYSILFHAVRHHRRKWFSFRRSRDSERILEESTVYSPPVSECITDEDLLRALAEVPPEYRDVILLCDVEEFSYKEAAAILGVPLGTIMSRLSRCRRMLRERLAVTAHAYGILREERKERTA